MDIEEAKKELLGIKKDNESKAKITHNNSSNIQIRWSNKDLKEMAEISNRCAREIRAIETVLNELEKKDIQIIKIREFLEKEQLELHDYDNNYDLSCEGKGRMYLVDELLEEYFTNKAENVGE